MYTRFDQIPERRPFTPAQLDTVHWGQRKCLLIEVKFLTQCLRKHAFNTVLYLGAADGLHMGYLAKLFPQLHFECWDPKPFHRELSGNPQITLVNTAFDLATAVERPDCILISDVREADLFQSDLEWQEEVLRKVRPLAASIKFTLPYNDETTTTVQGTIHLQPWCNSLSTETRLFWEADQDGFQTVNNRDYEQRLYYHNTVTRMASFETPTVDPKVDGSYDLALEIGIWREYMDSPNTLVVDPEQYLLDLIHGANRSLKQKFHKPIISLLFE